MLKEFAQYLVSLRENKTYQIDGSTWSDHKLELIETPKPRPKQLEVHGLDSVVKLVMHELNRIDCMMLPVYIRVDSENSVSVFTSWDDRLTRSSLYCACCDVRGFRDGFREYEQAIIELRSRFAPGEGVDYLLDLLSRITKENGVTTTDNGVSQQVEARTGISLKQLVNVRPRVTLSPFRTFLEVAQPESEFLIRLDDEGKVGLFEADGGMWKQEAKQNIAEYFLCALDTEIALGRVVVMV